MNKYKKQIYLATSADFVSGFGNGMFSFAIDLYVLRKSSSPLWFAGTQIVSPLISFFLSDKVGKLVDKYEHKVILRYAYIAEFFVTLMYFFLLRINLSMTINFFITLLVLTFINILNLVGQSAYQSSVVNIVTEDRIQELNSFQRLASSSAQLFSPALGAILYSLLGMDNMISIRIVTVLIALFLMMQINFSASEHKDTNTMVDSTKNIKVMGIIKKERKLFYAISMSVGVNIFLAISNIALPFMMIHILNFSNRQYGYQQTMLGLGSIVAGVVLSTSHRIKKPIKVSMMAMISVSISLIAFGLLSNGEFSKVITLIMIYTFSVIMGFSLVSMEIPMSTFMQSYVPKEIQGRIFSFIFGASQMAMPIGTIIATIYAYKSFELLTISGIIMMIFVSYNYLRNGI